MGHHLQAVLVLSTLGQSRLEEAIGAEMHEQHYSGVQGCFGVHQLYLL